MQNIVSVIIPVYNAEQYLKRCVYSVVNQSLKELEIILVDDGSTDGSGILCDELALEDSRISVVHQKNCGLSAARNAGMDRATGRYIAFVDADDEIPADAYEKLVQEAEASCVQMVFGRYVHISLSGKERIADDYSPLGFMRDEEYLNAVLEDRRIGIICCRCLYKSTFVNDIRFLEGTATGEDGYFNFCCALKKPLVLVTDYVVYRYYMNPTSITHSGITEKKCDDLLDMMEMRRQAIFEKYPHLTKKCNNLIIKTHLMLLRNFCHVKGRVWRIRERKSIEVICSLKKDYLDIIQQDNLFFQVIIHHLYYLYKMLVQLKKLRGIKK